MTTNNIIDIVVNIIKGQGRSKYSLDDKDEYYNKSKDEQFREDIEYCASNEDEFRDVLKIALSCLDD